jgi:preprotein translocase subunit SecG
VFGARGAGNFLSRSTWVLAALFCAISLAMAVMVSRIMTETPEADLGVVTAIEQPAQEPQQQPAQELSVGPEEPQPIDVPAFEPAAEAVPAAGEEAAAAEDLPPPAAAEAEQQPAADDN